MWIKVFRTAAINYLFNDEVLFLYKMVKAGLVLGLFGGTQRYLNDKVHKD